MGEKPLNAEQQQGNQNKAGRGANDTAGERIQNAERRQVGDKVQAFGRKADDPAEQDRAQQKQKQKSDAFGHAGRGLGHGLAQPVKQAGGLAQRGLILKNIATNGGYDPLGNNRGGGARGKERRRQGNELTDQAVQRTEEAAPEAQNQYRSAPPRE